MPDLERIWRITTKSSGTIEVRLSQSPQGDPQLTLERDAEHLDGAFGVEIARAVAQAMLEACEVARAVMDQEKTVVIR